MFRKISYVILTVAFLIGSFSIAQYTSAELTLSLSADAGLWNASAAISPGIVNKDTYTESTTQEGTGEAVAGIVRLIGGEEKITDPPNQTGPGRIYAKVDVKWVYAGTMPGTESGSTSIAVFNLVREESTGGRSASVSGNPLDVKACSARGSCGSKNPDPKFDSYPF